MTHEQPVSTKLCDLTSWQQGACQTKIPMTYEVTWHNTSTPFSQRFQRYLDQDFFEHEVHWFAILNSFIMVLFLLGLVALILLRTLKSDVHRYGLMEEGEHMLVTEQTGWKQVQSDVFRFPPYYLFLCGTLGTGVQLIIMVYLTIAVGYLGSLYIGRGAVTATAVVVYALASLAGGYVSARFYVMSRGSKWIRAMLLTWSGFSGVCVFVAALLNILALSWSSLAAIPFGTIVILLVIWVFVSLPLVLLGTLLGRHTSATFVAPARTSQIPRLIPLRPWYLRAYVCVPVGGLLPFGSIFIEMYFVFTSFWNYKFYYLYACSLLVFTILLVVSASVAVVLTYFLLNAEDYRWPWTAFMAPASTAVYVYAYAVFYFVAKTKMYGLFQTCFYFGQVFVLCLAVGIVCGTMGYLGARAFVFRIFKDVKGD